MVERKDHIDRFGAIVLVSWAFLLGTNQVMIKFVNSGFAPVFQAGLRSVCAFTPLLLYAWWANKRISVSDGSLLPGLVTGLFFSVEFMLMFLALDFTTVARVSLFFYTMPIWVAVGAHFLIPGERLTRWRSLGLMLAIIGVAIALSNHQGAVSDRALLGDIMAVGGATLWAGIVLVARTTALSRSTPEMQLLYQIGVSAILLMIAAPLFGETIREPTPAILAVFAIQVLIVVCIGFLIWFWVLSVYPASKMSAFNFLTPVFAVILGWVFFNETISIYTAIALILVCIGIVLVNTRSG